MRLEPAARASAALAVLALGAAACASSVHSKSERAFAPAPAPLGSTSYRGGALEAQAAPEPAAAPSDSARAAAPAESEGAQPAGVEPVADPLAVQAPPRPPPVVPPLPAPGQVPVLASAPAPAPELWRIDRGEGEVALYIPRDETLVYEVHLNLGWLGSPHVGKVTMTSQVRPFYSDEIGVAAGEQALIAGRAEGGYKVYTLDNLISAAILPQPWPHIIHRNAQTGTENRTREMMIGVKSDKQVSRYRADGHCKGCKDKAHYVTGMWPWDDDSHCKKCKRGEHRVWKDPKTREIPAGSVDMMTAVMLARSMVIEGRERTEFPLIERDDLWRVQLTRGKTQEIETTAGKFNAVSIDLRTAAPETTENAGNPEHTESSGPTKFEGLFGIHGTISIWIEEQSGVPIRIDGTVPAGPIELDATVELRSATGAPRSLSLQKK